MRKLPYFLTRRYYPAFLDQAMLGKLRKVYRLSNCVDNLVKRNSDVFHVGKKTVQQVVIYGIERFPTSKLVPENWDDIDIQADINRYRSRYGNYISSSEIQNTNLKRISINANLSYTKETIEAYFIYCSTAYWPIAYEFTRGIPFLGTYYELSPYHKLMDQYRRIAPKQLVFEMYKQSFLEQERVGSNFFIDKTKANQLCDSLNEYTAHTRFLKKRTQFREEYKQFIREAERTVKVVKEYLKKITKIADELTVVELKLNAEAFSKEVVDSNRSQLDLFEDTLDYRKKFLKYLQNQDYFNDIKGLIWRLDYDVSKQQYFYIFHIFFYILEGQQSKIDDIDNEWKKITKDKGSIEYSFKTNQEGYILGKFDLTNTGDKEQLIKQILAYYERDIFGHVNTHGKKGVSFSKKAIVPVDSKKVIKKSTLRGIERLNSSG